MKNVLLIFFISIISLAINAQPIQGAPTAKPVPSWVSNGVMYQIWLRCFTPEGNLKAARERLPDLADLGVDIIYLTPISEMDADMRKEYWSPRQKASPANNPKNPYRVSDYFKIDPEFGTEKDVKDFINAAHQLNMHVIIDIVYWHTGPANVLTKNPDFYQKDQNGNIKINNYGFLVLNYENKKLREYLYNNMKWWIEEIGADGFRCDVSASIPLDFWEDSRAKLDKIRPDIGMLAESNSTKEVLKAFDMSYGYPWYSSIRNVMVNGRSASQVREIYEKQRKDFPAGTLFTRFSDNHDQDRPVVIYGEKGSRAVSVLNFTIDGVPFLYNGQEIGDVSPFGIYYYPLKSDQHFTSIPWETTGLERVAEIRNWYKKLVSLRKSETALRNGETIWLETDAPQSVLAFLRRNKTEEILTVVNLSNRNLSVSVTFPDKSPRVYNSAFLTGKNLSSNEGTATLRIENFGYFIGKKQ